MSDKKYNINNRFLVDTSLNLVKDLQGNEVHRLEPRLISVLDMLADHVNELVTREQLTTDIWNNYGGAEDSLNQSISFLRKTLQDTNKEMIETVPKKGYILHASIGGVEDAQIPADRKTNFNFRRPAIAVIAFFAVIALSYLLLTRVTDARKNTDPAQSGVQKVNEEKENPEVNFSKLNAAEEEDYSNTITTTAPDGTRYRLVAIGDKRPKLYVNDKLISGPELEKYSEIEGQLLRLLWNRQKKQADSSQSGQSR